ncbi:hypothetical protein B0H13DRAFT_2363471 [Mycena leptocephala]|nr:hypothetical protein B0H13DRAFT_2363471 [Mycena leptocephala]
MTSAFLPSNAFADVPQSTSVPNSVTLTITKTSTDAAGVPHSVTLTITEPTMDAGGVPHSVALTITKPTTDTGGVPHSVTLTITKPTTDAGGVPQAGTLTMVETIIADPVMSTGGTLALTLPAAPGDVKQGGFAEDESSDTENGAANVATTATTNSHITAAIFDLPTELNIDTMDPVVCNAWLSTLGNAVCPIPQQSAHAAVPTVNPDPSPPSPTLTASSITSTATKKKKNKRKKKSATVNKIQSAFEGMSLKETDEAEYSR